MANDGIFDSILSQTSFGPITSNNIWNKDQVNALFIALGADAYKWNDGSGPQLTITYSFITPSSSFDPNEYGIGSEINGIQSWSSAQMANIEEAIARWEAVTNINLVRVTETASSAGDIRFGLSSSSDIAYAHAYAPRGRDSANVGDVWFQATAFAGATMAPGTQEFHTVIHELGHALFSFGDISNGLPGLDDQVLMGTIWDTTLWTQMSYKDQGGLVPQTPMYLDIMAARAITGETAEFNTGNNVYHADVNTLMTIWDDGGSDTLVWTDADNSAHIDLTPGQLTGVSPNGFEILPLNQSVGWSGMGDGNANPAAFDQNDWRVFIAPRSIIENAVGNSDPDYIRGNQALNTLLGNGGNDRLLGEDNSDFLHGGRGNDILDGGSGLDTADFSDITDSGVSVDLVKGAATGTGAGNDTLISIERATGTPLNDTFIGSPGDNVFDGNGGNDTLFGSLGNDVLLGEDGIDTADYSLLPMQINIDLREQVGYQSATAAGKSDQLYLIENATGTAFGEEIIGSLVNNTLRGGGGNDVLFGLAGFDTLDGGTGADYMDGGADGDLYLVDHANDVVVEGLNQGLDTIRTKLNVYSLPAFSNIETLEFVGVGSFTGTGDGLANFLIGGAGGDTLDGGGGNDFLQGIAGNDTYIVDSLFDTIIEVAGGGTDTVKALVSFDLDLGGLNVENLELIGTGPSDGTGNSLANLITGNSAANVLSGGGGNDTLNGGEGDDTVDGGLGSDKLLGGAGSDAASYAAAASAVTVSLALQGTAQTTGGAGVDTLSGFENLIGSAHADTLTGSTGDNVLSGGAGNDTLNALMGNDVLNGGDSDDILNGGAGNDVLNGEAGNDTLIGRPGADTLDGGADADTASYFNSAAPVTVNMTLAGPQASAGDASGDVLFSIENLIGSGLSDMLAGDGADNLLLGGAGADTLAGGGGDDTLEGGAGADVLTGGAHASGGDTGSYAGSTAGVTVSLALQGTAQITGGGGKDTLTEIENLLGSAFADTLTGDAGNNTLSGGSGSDTLIGDLGNDTLDGGAGLGDTASYATAGGAVTVNLSMAGAQSTAGAGTDTLISIERLIGSAFGDVLTGDNLANRLTGGAGDDTIEGGAGNDTLVGGAHGAAGDTVSYAGALAPVTVNLSIQDGVTAQNTAGAGRDILSGFENLTGSDLADTLTGSAGANVISGGGGDDTLKGGGGNDTLDGGAGDDLLIGGGGNDILTGGDGVDAFLFNSALGATNVDTITDFDVVLDRIRLENAVFTKLAATDLLSPEFFVIGTKALDANDFLIYDDQSGALYYDSNGSKAGGQVQFATLDPFLSLTAGDFAVV